MTTVGSVATLMEVFIVISASEAPWVSPQEEQADGGLLGKSWQRAALCSISSFEIVACLLEYGRAHHPIVGYPDCSKP